MSCTETRPLLAHRPLDVLDDDELGGLDAHLDGCTDCTAYVEALDAAYGELDGEPVEAELPETLWASIAQRIDEDAVEPEPSADEPDTALAIAVVCTYCHDTLTRPEARYCASCLAPHHADCFRAHGTCAAPGCEETHVVRPTLAATPGGRPRRPASRVWLAAMISGTAVAFGTVAALRANRARTAAEADRAAAIAADDARRADALRAEEQSREEMRLQERRYRNRLRELRVKSAEDESRQLAEEARRAIRGRRVYLGVRFEAALARSGQRTAERELLAVEVRADSVAKRAGVAVGDRLLAVDGKPVHSRSGLAAALHGVGEYFTLHVVGSASGAQRVLRAHAPPGVADQPFEGSVRARPRLRFKDGRSWLEVYADGDLTGRTFEVVSVTADVLNGNALRTRHLGYVTCLERLPRTKGWDLPPEWRVKGGWIANHADEGLWLRGPTQTNPAALLRSALRLNVDVDQRHQNLLRFVELAKARAAFESAIQAKAFAGRGLAIQMLVELWEERGRGPAPERMIRLLESAQGDADPTVADAAQRALKRLRLRTGKLKTPKKKN